MQAQLHQNLVQMHFELQHRLATYQLLPIVYLQLLVFAGNFEGRTLNCKDNSCSYFKDNISKLYTILQIN